MENVVRSMLFDLRGQVALVTGASRGIGGAIAHELASAGAVVVLSSEDAEACESAAGELRRAGCGATALPCDVAVKREVEDLVQATFDLHGQIDILVCNAGVAPHAGPIATAGDADWDATMTVNLRSILWLTNLVIPRMAARGQGSVIIVSSIAGLRGNKSIGLYGISKAGSAQLARNLAVEWGPSNVRVNAISPGVIRTEFAKPMLLDASLMERRIALTPLRRVGEPQEVAGAALLLAAPAGAFITGQNLIVDGGTTIGDGN
jgi:NAD(P)-dependent dehydrogenase (short-subunit alcohol dehydrogenase family)